VAPAFTLLIGEPTLDACRDFVAVEQVPGLQLKGKSAERFRIYQVVSIREDETRPWVPFPTEAAAESYDAIRRHAGNEEYVFAGKTPGDTA